MNHVLEVRGLDGIVEPAQLQNLDEEQNEHLDDLLVHLEDDFVLDDVHQILEKVQFHIMGNFDPIIFELLLHGAGGQILRIFVLSDLQKRFHLLKVAELLIEEF